MSQPYIGQITLFAGNFAPRGWHFCDGSLLSIPQNTALFSILGTTYGGNGTTTFALPDLRSRVPVQQGQGTGLTNYVLGQQAGVENVTLNSNQMPAHTHSLNATTSNSSTPSPTGNLLANFFPSKQENMYATGSQNTQLSASSIGQAGGNQPHTNIQPVLALNYIIALEGIYPSRN